MPLSIAPFFIVRNLQASISYYVDRLGFRLEFQGPDGDVYYAGVTREGASVMLKEIAPEVLPQPNHTRHPWARWDAYVSTSNPDSLYEEFHGRGVSFVKELSFIDDGLWGFEVADADGYVIAFFRVESPQPSK
jgi:catechol 2,3-dioxygenase-like lactoylglutathione lyase family enzyme